MVCQACGGPVAGPGAFCSKCGVQVPVGVPTYAAQPPLPYEARVQRHVQTLGILWCVYGVYRASVGLIGALVLAGISAHGRFGGWGASPDFPFPMHAPWMAALVPVVVVYTLIASAMSFATGFALMRRLPWGRTLAIVMGVLALFKLPVGTALGIFTLWVLAPASSGAEYDAIADRT